MGDATTNVMRTAASHVEGVDASVHAILTSGADPERVKISQDYQAQVGVKGTVVDPIVQTYTDPLGSKSLPARWKRYKWLALGSIASILVLSLIAGTASGRRAARRAYRGGKRRARRVYAQSRR